MEIGQLDLLSDLKVKSNLNVNNIFMQLKAEREKQLHLEQTAFVFITKSNEWHNNQ